MILGIPSLMTARRTPLETSFGVPSDRRINWNPAGLDVIGGIPDTHAHTVTITGLHDDGSVDDSATINAALAAAAFDTVLLIPAGVYLIDDIILMKNGTVLRGAKPSQAPFMPTADSAATTLIIGAGRIFFRGGDKSHNWYPGIQSGIAITDGYERGSTELTLDDATGLAANDYIAVYQNKDAALIDDKSLPWLGEDSGSEPHAWAQYTQITDIVGDVITIDPPLYQVTPSPTGQSVRKQTFDVHNAGLEDMRLYGNNLNYKPVWLQFCRFCWVKGCETYQCGGTDGSGSPHIWTEFCYANEYRSNYCHVGGSHDSGCDYGIEFYHWNSRHKIEDNIVQETRHSIVFEGGGSGCVILYNYTDDNWESEQGFPLVRDDNFLSEDQISNHGAHPYMNLWEGNHGTDWWGDYTQGSSSHVTLYRNSFTGKQTSYTLDIPNLFLWVVVEIETYNRYYNVVGNILGNDTMTGGAVLDDNVPSDLPVMFRFGHASAGGSYTDPLSYSTAILHGNYDYVGNAIVWADFGHTLPESLYYTEKPAYFGSLDWPPFDPNAPGDNDRERLPAGYRFVNGTDPP